MLKFQITANLSDRPISVYGRSIMYTNSTEVNIIAKNDYAFINIPDKKQTGVPTKYQQKCGVA